MTFTSLLTFSLGLLVAAAIPGPGITALVARTLGHGTRHGVPLGLGIILGDLVYLTAVVLGLAYVAQTFATLFLLIKFGGSAYLAWLAIKLWRSGMSITVTSDRREESLWASFIGGLSLTLGNPKTMLFYVSLMPALIDLTAIDLKAYAMLALCTVLVLSLVFLPYMLLADRARHWVADRRKMTVVNRVAACFMAAAALWIALRA